MISHGFRAARISLADMERFHAENPISRTSATFMRTADRLPTLLASMIGRRPLDLPLPGEPAAASCRRKLDTGLRLMIEMAERQDICRRHRRIDKAD